MKGKLYLKSVFSRPIAFHPILARIAGSVPAGLMLSQAIYWTDILESDREGWFHKTREQWEAETCLSHEQQEVARRRLRSLGLLIDERRGLSPVRWFRVDFEVLEKCIGEQIATEPGNTVQVNRETPFSEPGNTVQVNRETPFTYKEAETTRDYAETTKAGSGFPQAVENKPSDPQKARPTSTPASPTRQSKTGLPQSERDSWDLRRWREEMDARAPQTGVYVPDKDREWTDRAKHCAFLAGVSIPRLQELLRPFFTGAEAALVERLDQTRQLDFAEAK